MGCCCFINNLCCDDIPKVQMIKKKITTKEIDERKKPAMEETLPFIFWPTMNEMVKAKIAINRFFNIGLRLNDFT